jgi:hypothetical protein
MLHLKKLKKVQYKKKIRARPSRRSAFLKRRNAAEQRSGATLCRAPLLAEFAAAHEKDPAASRFFLYCTFF